MPSIKIKEAHTLGQPEAQKRIAQLLSTLKVQHADKISDIQENWQGNEAEFSFKIMGVRVNGKLRVTDYEVILDGSLPLTAALFKGIAEKAIRTEAQKLLQA